METEGPGAIDQACMNLLISRLNENFKMGKGSFELGALEAVLFVVTRRIAESFHVVKLNSTFETGEVMTKPTSAALDKLRMHEASLQRLEITLQSFRKALNSLLSSGDYQMIAFAHCLSDPERFIEAVDLPDNVECEIILEWCLQDVNAIISPLHAELWAISNAAVAVKRALAQAQIKISYVRVSIQALIGACGASTLVSAVFAMNLTSNIPQDTITLFWCLAAGMLIGPIIFTAVCV